MKRIAVIGGGLAGIAAAVRLADAGYEPVLIETRKRLGGRATSLVDPRSGRMIDNCQHVLMGCCTNLIALYERLGVLDQIEWHDAIHWTRGRGEIDTMRAGWLPAPLHLSGSLRRMRLFDRAQKRHMARAMWRMIRMGGRGRLQWASRSFGDFLRECDQPPELVRSFWNTIIVSACNLDVERVSAAAALQVFQEGFLANRQAYVMGLATVPLAELYAPAIDAIIEAGGDIQLGVSAKAIAYDGKRVTGVVTEEGVVEAAAVIAAVPFDRLDKLVSDTMKRADRRLQCLDRFEVSPILGVHLYFDQEIMPRELPHLVLVDPPEGVQWLFNKGMGEVRHSRESGNPKGSSAQLDSRLRGSYGVPGASSKPLQHIHAVVSGADEWMALDEDEIVRRVLRDVHHALPRSMGLEPVDARSIKEKRATFAAVPGVEALRPSASPAYARGGGIENLFLAGDWTDTGWPATMEGAVRSGYAAAAGAMGSDASVVPDLAPSALARWLGLR